MEIVDHVVQDRFRRRLEIFCLSRLRVPGAGDMVHARATTQADIAQLKTADAQGYDWRVLYYTTRSLSDDNLNDRLHGFAAPVEAIAARGGATSWMRNETGWIQTVSKSTIAQDSALRQGQAIERKMDDWWLMARPVTAEASCISCHKATKTGDPLGVMLYAVRKTP